MREPIAEHRLLSADEIRAGMRLAMTKAGRRGRVILFGAYSRGDFLADIDIMVVVDAYRRDFVKDVMEIRKYIELDRGIDLGVVTTDIFEARKGNRGSVYWEADYYGILLFDDRGEP
jgi:predicted nucleotidyltransferase